MPSAEMPSDKFTRDHEKVQEDGMTRCAPGRFPDRTKKWTDEETRIICESCLSTSKDLGDLLQILNSKKEPGSQHSVDSLRRKVEYLGVSGMMAHPVKAAPEPASKVPGGTPVKENSILAPCTDSPSAGDMLSKCGGLEGYLSMMPSCD